MKKILAGAMIMLILAQSSAFAATMTWQIRAFDRYAVDVKMFSKSRKNVWPSSTTVWTLKDYKVHSLKISCVAGEKICYGAFVRGNNKRYWGVGAAGTAACKNCCYTCNEGYVTPVNNLNE
jgi:hypothetical protein